MHSRDRAIRRNNVNSGASMTQRALVGLIAGTYSIISAEGQSDNYAGEVGAELAAAAQRQASDNSGAASSNNTPLPRFVLSMSNLAAEFSAAASFEAAIAFTEDFFTIQVVKVLVFTAVFVLFVAVAFVFPYTINEILRRFGMAHNYRGVFRWLLSIAIVLMGMTIAFAAVKVELFSNNVTVIAISIIISTGTADVLRNILGRTFVLLDNVADIGQEVSLYGERGVVVELAFTVVKIRSINNPQDVHNLPYHLFQNATSTTHGIVYMRAQEDVETNLREEAAMTIHTKGRQTKDMKKQ